VGEGGGVLARLTGNLDREISRRGGLWVDTDRLDDPNLKIHIGMVGIGNRWLRLRQIRREQHAGEAEKFFKRLSKGEKYWDDPLLWWAEVTGPLLDPATGRVLADRLNATLNGTPRTILRNLFSSSGEVESGVWAALFIFAILLFDVYLIATIMAVFMITGLSRAVNRLTLATAAVRAGDFDMRIPVRRRDQLGDLQRSFNEMSADLQSLVAAAAQKEALEKELAIARDLQKSLIPSDLPIGEELEFATLFEPTAAIGGDYFDVLRLSEDELAVVIADVSGHGLSSGLRMAMVKAALLILVEETRESDEILRRLDRVVRDGRAFVTATLGQIDLRTGTLRLTNAGHPPTYLLRRGEAREILLPSSPLGGLGRTYGHETVPLERGDVVVWLSDGLIEAADATGEPFGYDSVLRTLQGFPADVSAADVRNRLLARVGAHVGSQPPGDDRTLVVMRWRGRPGVGAA
jgi:sigma-B regulation protein RsbU (phosphoserine phosphatase)